MGNSQPGKPRRLIYRGFAKHDHVDVEMGDDPVGLLISRSFRTRRCPNCSLNFTSYRTERPKLTARDLIEPMPVFTQTQILFLCRHCGWWQVKSEGMIFDKGKVASKGVRGAYEYHALLEEIDISSNDVMLEDLKTHLTQKWNDWRFINASKAEQLVADILKDYLGGDVYQATANTNMRDGGIDLFVCASDGQIRAAVQVKRRQSRTVESVQDVRNFVGALVVEGYDKGIFVTTAGRFSPQAKAASESSHLERHDLNLS
jgi:restriction system protein